MTMKYAAFLRAVNVGGKNKIKMETLREVLGALEFQNVRTYINSGNVIFDAAATDDKKLAATIESAIEKEFALEAISKITWRPWRIFLCALCG